jgi:hypothetical protein
MVEQRRQKQDETDALLAEIEGVLDHAQVGIALTRDGRFETVSRAFCDLFGFKREDIVGQRTSAIHRERLRRTLRACPPGIHARRCVQRRGRTHPHGVPWTRVKPPCERRLQRCVGFCVTHCCHPTPIEPCTGLGVSRLDRLEVTTNAALGTLALAQFTVGMRLKLASAPTRNQAVGGAASASTS